MPRLAVPVPPGQRRCGQCWKVKQEVQFVGARGGLVRMCATCRSRYRNWDGKSLGEKLRARSSRRNREPRPAGFVVFVRESHNTKTGPIPVSISERGTCPPSCALYQAGCYADYGKLGAHWRRVGRRYGLGWYAFLDACRPGSYGDTTRRAT